MLREPDVDRSADFHRDPAAVGDYADALRFGQGGGRGKPRGGKPRGDGGGRPRGPKGPKGKGGDGGKAKNFEARPPKKDRPIDPDNPFAQALMGLKDKD